MYNDDAVKAAGAEVGVAAVPPLMELYQRITEAYNRVIDYSLAINETVDRLVGEEPCADTANKEGLKPMPYGGQYAAVANAVRNLEEATMRIETTAQRVRRLG